MASSAAAYYQLASERARLLVTLAGRVSKQSLVLVRTQSIFHAALALHVASWEAYIERVINEFFVATSNPSAIAFNTVHDLLSGRVEKDIKAFNTPNSGNARDLILRSTGYDPWPDWNWTVGTLSSLQARQALDDALLVRHSFAHGFSIPHQSWTIQVGGNIYLTKSELQRLDRFLKHLVTATDRGLSLHIAARFGGSRPW